MLWIIYQRGTVVDPEIHHQGLLSSISGSATPTEELLNAASKTHSAVSSTPRETASRISSSTTNKQKAHADFDFSKRQGKEEFQNIRERQGKKPGMTNSNTVKSPRTSKGRVSFESDLSVATPGVPPLDLQTLSSSADVTPISSSQTTPIDSPRYTLGEHRSLVHPEVTKTKHHYRSSSAPKPMQKYPGSSVASKSKSAILHANISTRDKTNTNSVVLNRRKFYNMDMKHFEATVTAGDQKPPNNQKPPSNQNVMRVNSEIYIPTPEMPRYQDSPVRSTTSLNDIKYLLDEMESTPISYSSHSVSESSPDFIPKPMSSTSSSFDRSHPSSSVRRDGHYKSRAAYLVMSKVPFKCQSLPNVVDAVESSQGYEDQYTHHNTTDHDLQIPHELVNRNVHNYQSVLRQDSNDSLLSGVGQEHRHITNRNKGKLEGNSTYTLPTKPNHRDVYFRNGPQYQ